MIDTAPIYGFGRSEQIVGKAIRGRRDKVVLATKCSLIWDREEGDFHFHADEDGLTPTASAKQVFISLKPKSIAQEIEFSLKRLEVDCIDLYPAFAAAGGTSGTTLSPGKTGLRFSGVKRLLEQRIH